VTVRGLHVTDTQQAISLWSDRLKNIVFDGAKAAVARIHLSQEPSKETLEAIRKSSDDILELTLLPL